MVFPALGLSEPILLAVHGEGYTTPTPIQSEAIPHVVAGRDLVGCAQTGTGKTAAFALPILHRLMQTENPSRGRAQRIRALVLSPTRELASQISDSFRTYGLHTGLRETVVFGGVSQHAQTRALQRGVDILVATPGRLLDLMNQGFIDLGTVEIFVLDEADRMLDMGFMPDVRRIIAKLPVRRQTLMFSATMPDVVARLTDSILRDPVRIRIAPVKATTKLIQQSVLFVPRQKKIRALADYLGKQSVTLALVFTRTKHNADRVARQLNQTGIPADALHGGKSQSARQRILRDFTTHRTEVLVATDIAARGLDVQGISHVFNFDLPIEPEIYVHRIGRTGRAGTSGVALSLCDDEERSQLRAIERLTGQALPVESGLSGSVVRVDPARPQGFADNPPKRKRPHQKRAQHSKANRYAVRG
jgi:ATP-dependent RNA helicase RhlE